jgi:ribose transport system permease protein
MKKNKWEYFQNLFPFIGLIVIVLVFTITSGDRLWTKNNLLSIVNMVIPLCLGASGMIFVASQGSTDMSMGSLLALCGTLGGLASLKLGIPGFILVSLLTGILFGAFNGVIVAYFKVPSLMVTLAMLIALRAVVSYITNGQAVFLDADVIALDSLYIMLPAAVVLLIIMWYVFSYTKIGFFSRCIGENQEVGRFSGIAVKKYKIFAFALSGLMAGVTGILAVVKIGGVSPTIGNFFELQIMTAMFVGGIPVTGGAGSKFYKIITGSFMLVFLQNGLTLCMVSAEISELIQGSILLIVVFMSILAGRRLHKAELNK